MTSDLTQASAQDAFHYTFCSLFSWVPTWTPNIHSNTENLETQLLVESYFPTHVSTIAHLLVLFMVHGTCLCLTASLTTMLSLNHLHSVS